MVIVLLLNAIFIGSVNAIDSKVKVVTEGRCPDLLKYNGVTVGCVRVSYDDGSSRFPAYCLQRDLPGIGDREGEYSSYELDVQGYITNPMIWRIISNSFPYNSFQGMGVKNIDEAYVATKQAIYCILYGNDADNFSRYSAIGAAGERTLNAMKKLVTIARTGTNTMPSKVMDLISESKEWTVDEKDNNYISKTYSTNAEAIYFTYQVNVDKTILPEGSKIVNMNNEEVDYFVKNEKFKILIPINHSKNASDFEVRVAAQLQLNPVYFGNAPKGLQDYALAAYGYEEGKGILTEKFIKNDSKIIIIKKDGSTNAALSGTEFNILDENKNIKYSNLITNQNGEIIITGIEPGTYFLQETKAREGYQKLEKFVEFNVELNKQITLTVVNNKIEKSEISINTEEINVNVQGSDTNVNITEGNQNINENNEKNDINISQSDKNTNEYNQSTNVNINTSEENINKNNQDTNININTSLENTNENNQNTNMNINNSVENTNENNKNTNVNINNNESNLSKVGFNGVKKLPKTGC